MKVLRYLVFFLIICASGSAYASLKLNVGGGAFFPTGDLDYDTGLSLTCGAMFSLESKYNFSTGFQLNYAIADHEDTSGQSIEIFKISQFLRHEMGKGLFIKGGFSIFRVKIDTNNSNSTTFEPGISIGAGGSLMDRYELTVMYNLMTDNNNGDSSPDYGDNYWTVTLAVLY